MLTRCPALGFLLLAMLVTVGCAVTKTGLETSDQKAILQPQAKAAPLEETYDDLLLQIAQQVPAFGGMFFEFLESRRQTRETAILYIYLLDATQKEAALQTILAILGPLYPDLLPPHEVRVLQAQYSFLQLKEWFDVIGILHHMPEVTLTDIDDVKNRLRIGVREMDGETVVRIEHELVKLGIPREAVILEKTGPFVPDVALTRALDENRNTFLDDGELVKALDLWIRQAPVPGTSGFTIDDATLLELIDIWQARRPLY